MRVSIFLSLALSLSLAAVARAEPAAPETFGPVFELAGIRLLCEQSAPLLQRGLSTEQQAKLSHAFDADALCLDLAKRIAPKMDAAQLKQVEALLDSPLAQRFTAAERAVGETDGLANYRTQLAGRPPRQDRLVLVQRLDKAAHTTELSALLRYEIGKTQALLALRARGENLDEQTLSARTQVQAKALQESSARGVESFMLYAYRQMPSEQLAEYAALYEQAPISTLLKASVQELPNVFASRRARLK